MPPPPHPQTLTPQSRGFSLAETLVATGLVTLLATLGSSFFLQSIDRSKEVACLANLRSWGIAMSLYIADHNGFLPRRGQGVQPVVRLERPDDWFNALPPYLGEAPFSELVATGRAPQAGDKSIFICPCAAPNPAARHFLCYGMNMFLSRWDKPEASRIQSLPDPSTLAVMADAPGGYASTVPSAAPYSTAARHRGRANILFLDGRVQSFPGDYLGCGTRPIDQPDVRWRTLEDGDSWTP